MYISSYDYYSFHTPRKILNCDKITIENKKVLVVEVEPPVLGQQYGLPSDISTLFLINRFNENGFDHLDKFPIDVYVLISNDSNKHSPSSLADLRNIVWACLYDNEKDARLHKIA
ncbi:MAG TPA: hypothetical protein VIM89_18050 [Mucilaginibacter sp.]